MCELFTDGTPLFDLSNLLAYRRGEYDPTPVLNKILDPDIRELVTHMTQVDPSLRLTAKDYLLKYQGELVQSVPDVMIEDWHAPYQS